jgi:hypothetical protein
MLADIKTKQCRNTDINNTKGRRKKIDRRQKFEKLITQLDRRNIQGRRDTKDRRLSKQKIFLFPVTQQGITIKALNFEQEKLIKSINIIISKSDSQSYLTISNFLKDVHFALYSQNSKEKVLYQWFEEAVRHSKINFEYATLIAQLNFILEQEMSDILAVLDKYLSLNIDLDENRELFVQDMDNIQESLIAYLERKSKYIYPYYQELLSLN